MSEVQITEVAQYRLVNQTATATNALCHAHRNTLRLSIVDIMKAACIDQRKQKIYIIP